MRLQTFLVLPLASQVVAAPAAADEGFAGDQTWGPELGFGGGWSPDTANTRRLEAFGYTPTDGGHYRMAFAVEKVLLRYFSLLLQTNLLDNQQWKRPSGIGPDDRFLWSSWTLDVHARAFLPIPDGRFRGYVQFGIGPTFTPSRLYTRTAEGPEQVEYKERKVSYNLSWLLGAEVMVATHVGFYLQGGYVFAPTLQDLLGDQLCVWTLEQGAVRKVSTWHEHDYAVELVGAPRQLHTAHRLDLHTTEVGGRACGG